MAAAAGIATHPVTIAMVLGISLQGSPSASSRPATRVRLEQAPPGQEGLYMGYATSTRSSPGSPDSCFPVTCSSVLP